MKKIVLSGYMGCGKTTVAKLLHAKTGIAMIDLDQYIENRTGLSISEIFASKGEIHFRKLEHEALKEVLAIDESLILSLGGGTPCYANNHELLKGHSIIWIFLKASPQVLYERIQSSNSDRPLLVGKEKNEAMEFIAQHLFERSFFYNQAGYKIDTNQKSATDIVDEIEKTLA